MNIVKEHRTLKKQTTYPVKSNEWRIDTYSYHSPYYDFKGPKTRTPTEFSIYDEPSMLEVNSWRSQTVSFHTFLIANSTIRNKQGQSQHVVLYHIEWEVKRVKNGGKWSKRQYNKKSEGRLSRPNALPFRLNGPRWIWAYEFNPIRQQREPIFMENKLALRLI